MRCGPRGLACQKFGLRHLLTRPIATTGTEARQPNPTRTACRQRGSPRTSRGCRKALAGFREISRGENIDFAPESQGITRPASGSGPREQTLRGRIAPRRENRRGSAGKIFSSCFFSKNFAMRETACLVILRQEKEVGSCKLESRARCPPLLLVHGRVQRAAFCPPVGRANQSCQHTETNAKNKFPESRHASQNTCRR